MDLTLTENFSLTYSTSSDERVDFFFHVIEGSSPERTIDLLEKSWKKYPLDTMKMIINCRDIRGGKGIRAQALICLKWLYENQFDNLMLNLIYFDEFGCWKDYLNLLIIALFNELPYDVDTSKKDSESLFTHRLYTHINPYDTKVLRSFSKEKRRELEMIPTICRQIERKFMFNKKNNNNNNDGKDDGNDGNDNVKNENKDEAKEKDNENKKKSKKEYIRQIINEKNWDGQKFQYKNFENYFPKIENNNNIKFYYKFKTNKAKLRKLNEYRREYFNNQYENDSKFQKIYNKIVELFVQQLIKDYDNYRNENFTKMSLACKWLPNYGRYFDKYTFIFESIAKKFFEIKLELLSNQKFIIRTFSKICTELRRKIQIPEILMSSKLWHQIDYKHVPSIAMLKYRQSFIRSDYERFKESIKTKRLNAGALTPADLVNQIMDGILENFEIYDASFPENINDEKKTSLKAIDNQWQSLINDIRKNGPLLFSNTLSVCDVSGSMYGSLQKILPIHAALGLSLFLMEIADDVWNDQCITFSEIPAFHKIDMKKSLAERCKQMLSCDFGMNTNLNKVFDLIINYGKERNLTSEQMPKILFIFTDMEFDIAMQEKTNFEACQLQYKLANYQMPFIVFWNLRGDKSSKSTPVKCNQNGVILLSGFSAQTFKFLLNVKNLNELNPLTMLMKIINDSRYNCIKIIE